ncbi:transposase family protein [Micromonospora sp. CNB394]|uniref:transposase family protein n=1 Tax=Micromonospora sp. CNB394 TaxID=1169151 RepID=UPI0003A359B8|nr:transposase family protein [Micromonospora sp. CNB394]
MGGPEYGTASASRPERYSERRLVRCGGRHGCPGGELTDVQRACNTALNSTRAAVERAIAHLVNWKILDTGWRGRLTEFAEALRTVTGLEIYRTWGNPF